jgi:hypothetical protein
MPNPLPGGPRYPSSSGSYPLTRPAWVTTSSYATAGIALRVSGALNPHHRDKVETPSVGGFAYVLVRMSVNSYREEFHRIKFTMVAYSCMRIFSDSSRPHHLCNTLMLMLQTNIKTSAIRCAGGIGIRLQGYVL